MVFLTCQQWPTAVFKMILAWAIPEWSGALTSYNRVFFHTTKDVFLKCMEKEYQISKRDIKNVAFCPFKIGVIIFIYSDIKQTQLGNVYFGYLVFSSVSFKFIWSKKKKIYVLHLLARLRIIEPFWISERRALWCRLLSLRLVTHTTPLKILKKKENLNIF